MALSRREGVMTSGVHRRGLRVVEVGAGFVSLHEHRRAGGLRSAPAKAPPVDTPRRSHALSDLPDP